MLIVTRRIGESVYIGNDIQVKVLGQRSGHVRFGFVAPSDVAIDREEVAERKKSTAGSASAARPARTIQEAG